MKFSSLAALKVVKLTTSSAASDENFIKMTTFSFQCNAFTEAFNLQNDIKYRYIVADGDDIW